MAATLISGGTVFARDQVIEDGAVLLREGKIAAVGPRAQVERPEDAQIFDAIGCIVAPGFVDIHIHGSAGADFMDGTPEAFQAICRYQGGGGTTALLATTASSEPGLLLDVLAAIGRHTMQPTGGAQILGAHIEGPFFNMEMRGCHLPEFVRPPTDDEISAILEHRDHIRSISLSPEIPGGLNAVRRFAEAGVVVSAAHTEADCELLEEAVAAGLSHSTHLYNAMGRTVKRGPHRIPGAVETILARDDISAEVIADGFHVHPLMIKLAYKAKGPGKLAVVTDAMRGAGMPDGWYTFGPKDGKVSFVSGGVSVMPEGTGFASSTIRMNDNVRTLVERVGLPLEDALRIASRTPAEIVHVDDRKGSLAPGYDADVVILEHDLSVRATFVAGGRVS